MLAQPVLMQNEVAQLHKYKAVVTEPALVCETEVIPETIDAFGDMRMLVNNNNIEKRSVYEDKRFSQRDLRADKSCYSVGSRSLKSQMLLEQPHNRKAKRLRDKKD